MADHGDEGGTVHAAGGYGPPGGYGATPGFHPMAVTSMVLGIFGIPCCCCWSFGSPLLPIAAIVLGIVAIQKIRSAPQTWKGTGMAIAGIVCAAIALPLDVIAAFFSTLDDQLIRHLRGG